MAHLIDTKGGKKMEEYKYCTQLGLKLLNKTGKRSSEKWKRSSWQLVSSTLVESTKYGVSKAVVYVLISKYL